MKLPETRTHQVTTLAYRREIDGLRAWAVLPVLFYHSGFPGLPGGFLGVDVFFVISGYLITLILMKEMAAGNFTFTHFYERRARRILPLLLLIGLICLPFSWALMLPAEMEKFLHSLAAIGVFSSNILFWKESGYFDTPTELKPLLHTWSLSVEEQFYLFYPLLLLACHRLFRQSSQRVLYVLVLLWVCSLLVASWAAYHKPVPNFYLLPTRAWELLTGGITAWLVLRGWIGLGRPSSLHQFGALLGLMLIVASMLWLDKTTPLPGLYALPVVLGAALVIGLAIDGTWVARLLGLKFFVGIGLISYGLYLWHQPVFAFARLWSVGKPSTGMFAGLMLLTLFFSYTSWRWFESPLRHHKTWRLKQIAVIYGSFVFLFVALSYAGVQTEGFSGRFVGPDLKIANSNTRAADIYTHKQRQKYHHAPFVADARPKLLIIGDSMSADVLNALHSVGVVPSQVQVSTHWIDTSCGNLYLPYDLSDLVVPGRRAACRAAGRYEDPALRTLLQQADSVWVASAWKAWEADRLQASINRIRQLTTADITVVGRKDFGVYNIRHLIDVPVTQRPHFTWQLRPEHLAVNQRMAGMASNFAFINFSQILCEQPDHDSQPGQCRLFTPSGELISFDGVHFTPDGAAYAGKLLLKTPGVRQQLGI